MIAEIVYYGGMAARALKHSDDIPTRAAAIRELQIERARALASIIGPRKTRPPAMPSAKNHRSTKAQYAQLDALTCRDLDRMLRKLNVAGRSKARRKAQKIELLLKVQRARK